MVCWKMGTVSWPGMAPHRSAEMDATQWPTVGSPLPAEEKEDEDGDCDAHIAGLAEQIAHSMLEDDEEEGKQCSSSRNMPSVLQQAKAAWNAQVSVPCSFQSTTAGVSMCNWELKRAETLKLLSQLSSPLQQRIESEALELLYAELVRLKMEEKMRALAATQRHTFYPKPFNVSPEGFSPSMGSSLNPAEQYHSFGRLQNQQFHARKQAGVNWVALNSHHRPSSNGDSRHRTGATVDHSYSCYQQHCINGSGMRAVSLGAPSSRESGGTGVFLPRSRTGSRNIAPERKRKPASTTVLLPSRIVHALNLNVEDTLSAPVSASTINTAAHREFPSPALAWRRDTYNSNRRTDSLEEWPSLHHPSCSPLQEVAPDISLPTEWTY